MAVKIVAEGTPGEERGSDYVRITTCHDPGDDTVTLATIERIVAKQRLDEAASPVYVKTLVLRRPMSTDAALGFATRYAERKNIPVVCTS